MQEFNTTGSIVQRSPCKSLMQEVRVVMVAAATHGHHKLPLSAGPDGLDILQYLWAETVIVVQLPGARVVHKYNQRH